MNTFFQTQHLDLDIDTQSGMVSKMEGLNRFFSPDAKAFINIEKTRASNNGDDLYYLSIQIEDGKYQYYTKEEEESVQAAFNQAYAELFRIVRDDKRKSRSLARRAGQSLKNLFRRK